MKSRTLAIVTLMAASCLPLAADAHCFCKIRSNSTAQVKDFGELKTYTNINGQNQANQNDCKNICANTAAAWASGQSGAVCEAFKSTKATYLRAYAAVGTRSYDWCGSTITPPAVSKIVLKPRYHVLTILYALPGCTPTTAYNCSSLSSANYSNGTSTSTEVSIEKSLMTGTSVTADQSMSFPLGDSGATLGLSTSSTNSFSVTSSRGSKETVSKSQGVSLSENSAMTDGIDHGLDQFQLLMNPVIVLTKDCVKYGNGTGWNLGFSPPFMVLQQVTACQILNTCGSVPAGVASGNLTPSDYCSILAQDPFVAHCKPPFNDLSSLDPPALPVDPAATFPGRFRPTTFAPSYNPPLNGVCSPVFAEPISNESQDTNTTSTQTESSSSSSLGASISAGDAAKFGLTQTDSVTFTNTVSVVNTSTTSQSAEATIACAGSNWTDPNSDFFQVGIYWDNLYSSFLFVPMTWTGQHRILHGTVTDASGKPAARRPVQLFFGGKTYHTSTDNQGGYKIYSSAIKADAQHLLPAKVTVGGVTADVTLGSPVAAAIKIPGCRNCPEIPLKASDR